MNVQPLDYTELGEAIASVYLDTEKYQVDKHVPTFVKDGKYIGDFFNFTMCELDGDNPPIFYHIYSPYDVVSGKSTQQAVVIRAGELEMALEFTPFMQQRTGVMSSLVLKHLGFSDIHDKSIAFVGTGRLAQHDLAALKQFYPSLQQVEYVSSDGAIAADFTSLAQSVGVKAQLSSLEHMDDFDVIICHTSSKTPVLTADMVKRLKQGAVITTFSSEDFTEVAQEFFDTQNANIVVDWDQTADEAPELQAAINVGLVDRAMMTPLKTLFQGNPLPEKNYTIYRSHGTPMQNLAALQLLRSRTSKNS